MDRASACGAEGQRFESSRVHHKKSNTFFRITRHTAPAAVRAISRLASFASGKTPISRASETILQKALDFLFGEKTWIKKTQTPWWCGGCAGNGIGDRVEPEVLATFGFEWPGALFVFLFRRESEDLQVEVSDHGSQEHGNAYKRKSDRICLVRDPFEQMVLGDCITCR